MLITYSVENFLSFRDRHTFSMVAGMGGRNKAHHIIKKNSKKDVNLVKTAVLFGANASGKSNLVKAIHFGQQLLLKGTAPNHPINFQPFKLDKDSLQAPSRMEFEIKHKGRCYAYGFIFGKRRIEGEWLYQIDNKRSKPIFEREFNKFDLTPLQARNPKSKQAQFLEFIAMGTPENQLFLTEIHHRNVEEHVDTIDDLLHVLDWFQNALTIWYPHSKTPSLEFELHQSERLTTMYKEFLSYFDTGIDGISLEEIELDQTELPEHVKDEVVNSLLNRSSDKTTAIIDSPIKNIRYFFSKNDQEEITVCKLMTKHRIAGSQEYSYFDVHEESDGTQRIMDFIPMLVDLLAGDNVFIVDEMERSLHPNLIYELLELFLEHSTGINSQLILASHAPALLTQDLLRKDEIWFVKKDQQGASSIYSLEEYDIRFDKKIRKDYLLGRFQAVPKFGNPYKLSAVVASNISDEAKPMTHEV